MQYLAKAYGAVGDGVTEGTAAFRRAITSDLPLLVPVGDDVISGDINVATGDVLASVGS